METVAWRFTEKDAIANAPFLRPDLDRIVRGLGFIIEKSYPIRGAVT